MRRKRSAACKMVFGCAVVVALLGGGRASAQDADADTRRAAASRAAAAPPGMALGTLAGATGAAKASAFQAMLDASTDDKTGTAVFGWKDGTSVYALTFKAPLGSKGKDAVPVTLDGLTGGASVQLALNHLSWRGPSPEEQAAFADLCARVLPGKPCDLQALPAGADRDRMVRLLHLDTTPWLAGITGGVSEASYTWRDGAQFSEHSRRMLDWTLGVQAGVFRPQVGFLLASVSAQRTSHAGADSVSLCRPLAGTDATTCANAVLKAPAQSTGAVASVQLRRTLSRGVAIAPQVQYDVKTKVCSVQVPVYFLKDSKGSPIGGVRASWRSDRHAVVVSLFVGAAFGLTP